MSIFVYSIIETRLNEDTLLSNTMISPSMIKLGPSGYAGNYAIPMSLGMNSTYHNETAPYGDGEICGGYAVINNTEYIECPMMTGYASNYTLPMGWGMYPNYYNGTCLYYYNGESCSGYIVINGTQYIECPMMNGYESNYTSPCIIYQNGTYCLEQSALATRESNNTAGDMNSDSSYVLASKDVFVGKNATMSESSNVASSTIAASPYTAVSLGLIFLAAAPITWRITHKTKNTERKLSKTTESNEQKTLTSPIASFVNKKSPNQTIKLTKQSHRKT